MGQEPHLSVLDSIGACRAQSDVLKGESFDAIRSFPDDKLGATFGTPWGFSWRHVMAHASWNPMDHVGQVTNIPMIHGGTSMDS